MWIIVQQTTLSHRSLSDVEDPLLLNQAHFEMIQSSLFVGVHTTHLANKKQHDRWLGKNTYVLSLKIKSTDRETGRLVHLQYNYIT